MGFGMRVIVVDDEPRQRRGIANIIKSLRPQAETAYIKKSYMGVWARDEFHAFALGRSRIMIVGLRKMLYNIIYNKVSQ